MEKNLMENLKAGDSRFALLENQPRAYEPVRGIAAEVPDRVVRAHTISPEEMRGLTARQAQARWVRSAKERSCRFFYFRWNPDWSAEENLKILRGVAQELKAQGFTLKSAPGRRDLFYAEAPLKGFRLFFAFLTAVAVPVGAAGLIRKRLEASAPPPQPDRFPSLPAKSELNIWLTAVLAAVSGGLLIQTVLPDTAFVNGLEVFRGVKASLLLPLLLSIPVLYSRQEIEEFLKKPVSVWGLAGASAAVFAVAVLLERSGNAAGAVHPFELKVRGGLECLFGARPRFKEFLVGHPFMILGLYLAREKNEALPLPGTSLLCVWIGGVGLISIINNFCHLHTPLLHSLLRTFHGLWLGGLLGILLIFAFRFIRKKT